MPEARFHFPIHRLLGHPDPVQVAMHDELPGKPEEWCLLFQMDSDSAPETNWGDTGRIFSGFAPQTCSDTTFTE